VAELDLALIKRNFDCASPNLQPRDGELIERLVRHSALLAEKSERIRRINVTGGKKCEDSPKEQMIRDSGSSVTGAEQARSL